MLTLADHSFSNHKQSNRAVSKLKWDGTNGATEILANNITIYVVVFIVFNYSKVDLENNSNEPRNNA